LILLLNFCINLHFWTQISKEKRKNFSGLADLSPLFFKVPLIVNPLTAVAICGGRL
jgi:hypothetical protein